MVASAILSVPLLPFLLKLPNLTRTQAIRCEQQIKIRPFFQDHRIIMFKQPQRNMGFQTA